jgi:light-regulated signal transduction histidine kinase (bacteriophytochrome)
MKRMRVVSRGTRLSPRSKFTNFGETVKEENPPWDSLRRTAARIWRCGMAIYAAMIDRMDRNIGRVTADLRARGELDNTLSHVPERQRRVRRVGSVRFRRQLEPEQRAAPWR